MNVGYLFFSAPKVDNITLTSAKIEWQTCRPMADDKILYVLQIQSRDHEYKQVIKIMYFLTFMLHHQELVVNEISVSTKQILIMIIAISLLLLY